MATLFQRVCSVLVDDLKIDGLRCQFKVTKTLTGEPNTLDLKITNLSATSRARMQKKSAQVVLSAGYVDASGVIFSGDARTIDHVREGADWTTHIQCGDGERAYTLSRFVRGYSANTPVVKIINDAANALGINSGNLSAMLSGVTQHIGHGYAARGPAAAELGKLLTSVGLAYSIQDGALQVRDPKNPLPGEAVFLSPDTGLIGSPDHGTPDKKGAPAVTKIKSLLQPLIKCGGAVQVDSLGTKGVFHVQKLEHEGDTAGGNWYTSIEGVPGAV